MFEPCSYLWVTSLWCLFSGIMVNICSIVTCYYLLPSCYNRWLWSLIMKIMLDVSDWLFIGIVSYGNFVRKILLCYGFAFLYDIFMNAFYLVIVIWSRRLWLTCNVYFIWLNYSLIFIMFDPHVLCWDVVDDCTTLSL